MNKYEALEQVLDEYFPALSGKFHKNNLLKVISKKEYSLEEIGYAHRSGASRACRVAFPNKPANVRLCSYLLSLVNKIYCSKCETVVLLEKYNLRTRWCKECCKTYQKVYQQEHKQEQVYRTAKRRAAELQATPKWANLEKIKEIYRNCPNGYHVDHVIPLQGKNICGLHVETNLQYLTAEDNLRKGNRFNSS